MAYYLSIFILTAAVSGVLTAAMIKVSLRLKIVDKPTEERKIQKHPVPLLGGFAVFAAFFGVLTLFNGRLVAGDLEYRHWIAFFIGALFIMIGGFLDDKYNLSPLKQVIFPVLAPLCVIIGGVSIAKITNPMGGFFYFSSGLSAGLIFVWLTGMMYTTKLLDGIDGLVAGVTAIGGFIIFLFTLSEKYYQPDIALAALVLSAACFGFLIFNWHPARIFLGEGGSLLLGFILGVLAIISGGKIAIALLVMGIPIMDVIWTIIRRLWDGKNPFRFSDKKHLHFRILDLGIGQRKTVIFYYILAAVFGSSALYLQSLGKVLAMIVLILIMFFMVIVFSGPKK